MTEEKPQSSIFAEFAWKFLERDISVVPIAPGSKKPGQVTIGFAAEAQDLERNAAGKLERKNLDLIVANPVDEAGAGFATPTNRVLVMDRHGRRESWPQLPKTEIAWRIWDWILTNTP